MGGPSLLRRGMAAAVVAGFLMFIQMRILGAAGRPYPPCRPDAAAPGVVRLHVLAASDTGRDQAAKVRVRDAVARLAARVAHGAGGPEDALTVLGANREALARAAAEALAVAGIRDRVGVDVGWHRFPGGSLAAGCYRSVVVTIGRGRGHNWWCVLYPPVCLPLAAVPGVTGRAAAPSGSGLSASPAAGRRAAALSRPAPPPRLRWYVAGLAARLAAVIPVAPSPGRTPESERVARSHMLGR